MRKLPPLSALRAFEAAARRRSFKHAANELHVTPTAVSHQIRHLEKVLGTKLFERGTRQVRLSSAGQLLFPPVRDGLDSFEHAVLAVRRSASSNVARLTSTVAFMARRLAPLAGSFREAYPDWTLRLDGTDKTIDLDVEADAAIRYGPGQYPGLLVEPLFQDRFAPVCSPTLAITTMDDLRRCVLIHFEWGPAARDDERAYVWRDWLKKAGMDDLASQGGGLAFTEEIHAVQAAVAGQGVALLSLTLVAQELAAGVLVQPFALSLESFRYDLVSSPRAADRPATSLLREWIKARFGGQL